MEEVWIENNSTGGGDPGSGGGVRQDALHVFHAVTIAEYCVVPVLLFTLMLTSTIWVTCLSPIPGLFHQLRWILGQITFVAMFQCAAGFGNLAITVARVHSVEGPPFTVTDCGIARLPYMASTLASVGGFIGVVVERGLAVRRALRSMQPGVPVKEHTGIRTLRIFVGIGWLIGIVDAGYSALVLFSDVMSGSTQNSENMTLPGCAPLFDMEFHAVKAPRLVLPVFILAEVVLVGSYVWLWVWSSRARATWALTAVTHSLDRRFELAQTIAITRSLLPIRPRPSPLSIQTAWVSVSVHAVAWLLHLSTTFGIADGLIPNRTVIRQAYAAYSVWNLPLMHLGVCVATIAVVSPLRNSIPFTRGCMGGKVVGVVVERGDPIRIMEHIWAAPSANVQLNNYVLGTIYD